jgi:outer membrane protein assembly factor BamB
MAGSWSTFRGNANRTGVVGAAAGGSGSSGALAWRFATGGPVRSSPVIATDGSIYFGSDDFNVYALHANGSLKWAYTTIAEVRSTPALGADGTIYVGSLDSNIYALNPADGSVKWDFNIGGPADMSPAIAPDGSIYFGSIDGGILAGVTPAGAAKWVNDSMDSDPTSSPTVSPSGTVYVATTAGAVALTSAGAVEWAYDMGIHATALQVPALALDGRGEVVLPLWSNLNQSGAVLGLGAGGRTAWEVDPPNMAKTAAAPAVGADGCLYVAGGGGYVSASYPNGSVRWAYHTVGKTGASSPAVGGDGTVYVGSDDSNMYAISSRGELAWHYATGEAILSSPAIGNDGSVYVGSNDGYLYAFAPSA